MNAFLGAMAAARYGTHAHLELMTAPVIAVADAAYEAARKRRQRAQPARGATLKAGRDTPRWNQLADEIAKCLRRRGDKSKLARALGISRQRLHLLIVARTAFPDAERALQLQAWLHSGQPSSFIK
ncbi:MAG: hypothetical protein Q7S40_18655 [Opitutaceae bacterium]|nr:hypothetical protein [Opitutaceae bacterium]